MNTCYLTLEINGQPFNCLNSMSLQDIMIYLNIDVRQVLVEYNNEILDHQDLSHTLVQQNDKLEIITIVGGG
jgi:sulfur carrier protein